MKRAAERAETGDVDSAIRLYTKAIEEDPTSARGHLDAALLWDDYKQDYVRAIFHYRRYLELREQTEKRSMIEERVRRAEHLFAASIMVPSQQNDAISKLEKENSSLKTNVRTLTRKLVAMQAELEAQSVATFPAGGPNPAVSGAILESGDPRPESYTVQPGDSLTRIAESIYGDPKRWPDIQRANQRLLGRSTQVQPGQVLKLP
ncbi:MAG: LysM peptidoglycan-binding domain-containing protein [Verrucomicrobia bacterium]|nr:LysM peptidoglycan-binding domain-containing protein [Verrucomicrobiota bacterium]